MYCMDWQKEIDKRFFDCSCIIKTKTKIIRSNFSVDLIKDVVSIILKTDSDFKKTIEDLEIEKYLKEIEIERNTLILLFDNGKLDDLLYLFKKGSRKKHFEILEYVFEKYSDNDLYSSICVELAMDLTVENLLNVMKSKSDSLLWRRVLSSRGEKISLDLKNELLHKIALYADVESLKMLTAIDGKRVRKFNEEFWWDFCSDLILGDGKVQNIKEILKFINKDIYSLFYNKRHDCQIEFGNGTVDMTDLAIRKGRLELVRFLRSVVTNSFGNKRPEDKLFGELSSEAHAEKFVSKKYLDIFRDLEKL